MKKKKKGREVESPLLGTTPMAHGSGSATPKGQTS